MLRNNRWQMLTNSIKQAGAELCQAQGKLEVIVEVEVEIEAYHY